MLRQFLERIDLLSLPVAAMLAFLLFFLAVLWRVSRRSRSEQYRRMARLPLDDRAERTHP